MSANRLILRGIIFTLLIGSIALQLIASLSPFIPGTPMIEVQFSDLNNLPSIETFQGVTQISFGIWKVCYSNVHDQICTQTSRTDFFIVQNGDATVWQQASPGPLVLIPIGCGLTVFFTILLFFYYRWTNSSHTRIQEGIQDSDRHPLKESVCVNNCLTAISVVFGIVIVITNAVALQSVHNAMQKLGRVTTKPGLGFWLTVGGEATLLVVAFFKILDKIPD